jgi:23S rRNA (uracil1939-C5)-methyltransferase
MPCQDARLNPLLAEIKQDIEQLGWSVYNEERHQGRLRHLSLRIGRRTGEMLLTLVTTDWRLQNLDAQAQQWLTRYPKLVGICVNRNPNRTNVIFGR